jgi:hypothetical protein
MEPKSSLSCSQHATAILGSITHTLFLERPSTISSHVCPSLQFGFLIETIYAFDVRLELCMVVKVFLEDLDFYAFVIFPCMLHILSTSDSWI